MNPPDSNSPPEPPPPEAPSVSPGLFVPRWLVLLAVGLGLMLGLSWSLRACSPVETLLAAGPRPRSVSRVSIDVIRDEQLMFLVTNRIVTQVLVEQKEHSLWTGGREGYLIATVRLYYGVDLSGLTQEALVEDDQQVVVRVPEPSLLEFAIDPQMKFVSKRTGFHLLKDYLEGRDMEADMRLLLKHQALGFAHQHELIPDRQTILNRLNGFAPALSAKAGKPVRFEYE